MRADAGLSRFSEELNRSIAVIWRQCRLKLSHEADPFTKGLITFPQFLALDILNNSGKLKMKDVSVRLNISLPAASGLIDRLVGLEMVLRGLDPSDRRIIYIRITPAGKSVVNKVYKARKKIIEDIFSCLNNAERSEYLKIIKKVSAHIEGRRDE